MNNGEIIALLHRIATSLEKIANHLDKPQPKQKVLIQCVNCKGTGKYKYPFSDCETDCLTCAGHGQTIKSV